jgi:hypothetical protein
MDTEKHDKIFVLESAALKPFGLLMNEKIIDSSDESNKSKTYHCLKMGFGH